MSNQITYRSIPVVADGSSFGYWKDADWIAWHQALVDQWGTAHAKWKIEQTFSLNQGAWKDNFRDHTEFNEYFNKQGIKAVARGGVATDAAGFLDGIKKYGLWAGAGLAAIYFLPQVVTVSTLVGGKLKEAHSRARGAGVSNGQMLGVGALGVGGYFLLKKKGSAGKQNRTPGGAVLDKTGSFYIAFLQRIKDLDSIKDLFKLSVRQQLVAKLSSDYAKYIPNGRAFVDQVKRMTMTDAYNASVSELSAIASYWDVNVLTATDNAKKTGEWPWYYRMGAAVGGGPISMLIEAVKIVRA